MPELVSSSAPSAAPPNPANRSDTNTAINPTVQTHEHILWDRKTDGGFPETKELKRRVRDLVEPGRGLGHVDRDYEEKTRTGKGEKGGEVRTQGEDGGGVDKVVVEGSGPVEVREGQDENGREKGEGEKCEDCA